MAALAALALSGCSGTGVQAVTAAPTAPASAGPSKAVVAVARNKPQLLEVVRRFNDQGCAYGRSGETCSTDTVALGRLAGAMRMDLDGSKPWSPEVADLAGQTASRLASVEVLLKDPAGMESVLDTQLVQLERDLQSWSAYGG